jgi:putative phosphoribosyl transferase
MRLPFANRAAAARLLAQHLAGLHLPPPIVVLGLPRGGVPIAAEVARVLKAGLDLLFVRKIGVPWQPELAVAAVVEGERPEIVIDEQVQRLTGVDRETIAALAVRELAEIERRRGAYLQGRAPLAVQGATAIVVDDGIATGTTVRAALKALRRRRPARLVLAVPVAPHDTVEALRSEVDDLVCLAEPYPFCAVGLHYDDFHQVEDAEVLAALADAAASPKRGTEMNRTWVVVANAARARLCEFDPRNGALTEMADFVHPSSRQKGNKLATDRPGHAEKGQASMRTSFEPHTDAQHKEHERFARELALQLNVAVAAHRCPAVALVASNPFLGEIKAHLDDAATRVLVATEAADLTHCETRQLERRVAQLLEAAQR